MMLSGAERKYRDHSRAIASVLEYAHEGDQIRFKDTRGKKRKLDVILKDEKGLVVETIQRRVHSQRHEVTPDARCGR